MLLAPVTPGYDAVTVTVGVPAACGVYVTWQLDAFCGATKVGWIEQLCGENAPTGSLGSLELKVTVPDG